MQRNHITKYSYKPIKKLKAPAMQRQDSLLKHINSLLTSKKNAAVACPVRYSYSRDIGVVQQTASRSHHRISALLASAAVIGVAVSLPLDRSIASASLDSLQAFLDNGKLQEHMSRLQLHSLQATVIELQTTTNETELLAKPTLTSTIDVVDTEMDKALQLSSYNIPSPENVSLPLVKPDVFQVIKLSDSKVPVVTPVDNKNLADAGLTPVISATPTPVKYVSPVKEQPEIVRTVSNSSLQKTQILDNEQRLFITVKSGDNLSRLFKRHKLSIGDLHRILKLGHQVNALKRLEIGQKIFVQADGSGSVLSLQLALPNSDKKLHIAFAGEKENFIVATHNKRLGQTLKTHTELVNLKISEPGKLQQIAQQLELHDELSFQLKDIFSDSLDLEKHNLAAGDQIRILFEAYFYQDEMVKLKHVLAAEVQHKEKNYQAVRYTDAQKRTNYYTPEGQGLFSDSLGAPVKNARITSHFSRARRHPILKIVRPHLGIDYGADRGEPIYATADGIISHKGWQGGYGRTVKIEHQQNYETLYAHMSKYAKGLKEGEKVSQGQIIGYVGNSGLSTGNHLHYEVLFNGEHRNPLTTKLPQSKRINVAKDADFIKKSQALLAQLTPSTQLARASKR